MLEQGPADSAPGSQATLRASFKPRCLCIDLEVGVNDSRIHAFAAVRGDTGASYKYSGGDLSFALRELDRLAEGASFVLGHNIVAFDLPHLAAADPRLRLLKLPAVDTLRINPLAFPRNPYHYLVKHYQDGQLRSGQRNNPLLDAQLALQVFQDQSNALADTQKSNPDLMLAWHWLTTLEGERSGLNAFFLTLRRGLRPADDEAKQAMSRFLADRACATHSREVITEPPRTMAGAWRMRLPGYLSPAAPR